MYDVYSCGFDGVIVRLKRAHKQQILIFPKDFACPRSHEHAKESLQPSEPDDFWVTEGSLWGQFGYLCVTLGHLMVTSQSLWRVYKGRFQKTLIFPTDFNDFIKLLGENSIDLGLLWELFCHMRVT